MKNYELKEGEKVIMTFTLSDTDKHDKVANIVTLYEDADKRIYVHNSNGIKQDICPYLRYAGTFYCSRYANIMPQVDYSHWETQSFSFGTTIRNPQYKNCDELGSNAEEYIKCKYYKSESEEE